MPERKRRPSRFDPPYAPTPHKPKAPDCDIPHLFNLGDIEISLKASRCLEMNNQHLDYYLYHHSRGVFGDIRDDLIQHNKIAMKGNYGAVWSLYKITDVEILSINTVLPENETCVILYDRLTDHKNRDIEAVLC